MGRQIKIAMVGDLTSIEISGDRLELTVGGNLPALPAAPASSPQQYINAPLALKVGADGKRAADDSKDHIAVLYPYYSEFGGLLIDARRPIETSVRDSAESIAKQSLFGQPLQLLSDTDLLLTIDRSFREPAVNPDLFPNTPSSGWLISNKPLINPDRSPSGYVWAVALHGGYVDCVDPGYDGFVRGGRLVPASQVLGFLAGGSL